MYLPEKYSLKHLWIFEMVLELLCVLSCFVLIIIQIPSNPSVDYSPEKEFNEYEYRQRYLNSFSVKTENSSSESTTILGYWTETTSGCDCRGIFSENITCENMICRYQCDDNQTLANCTEIDPVSFNIKTWRKKQFLASDVKYSYLEMINHTVKKGKKCPEGTKQCGILDNFDNVGCFPINEDCPINFLTISTLSEMNISGKNITTTEINDGYYLHTSNEFTENRLINSYFRIFSPEIDYILSTSYCYGESTSYTLNRYNKEAVFKENEAFDKLYDLPEYPIDEVKNYNMTLYYTLVDVPKDITICRNLYNESITTIYNNKGNITTINFLNGFSIPLVIFSFILIVFQLIFEDHDIIGKNIIVCFGLGILGIPILLIFIAYLKIDTVLEIGFPNYDNKCVFPVHGKDMEKALEDVKAMKPYSKSIMWICFGAIVSYFIDLIYAAFLLCREKCKECSKKREEEKRKELLLRDLPQEESDKEEKGD